MKKNSSNLNKKRTRPVSPLTITIGKLPHEQYYYISDSISSKANNTKIKISMVDMKEDTKQKALKDHEEENDITNEILAMGPEILKEELPKIVNTIQINENENIYLPISSSWFNMDNIHEIEMKSNPEFFVGKYPTKTPQIYKKYRNFIINLYRENPSMYLSSKTCNKHLAGDTAAIMRIHSFLENWGLINFKSNLKFKPNFIPKAFNFKSPIFIDANLFMFDNSAKNENINNYNSPESPIVLTNKNKYISTLYPINKISNEIFNKFLDNLTNIEKELKSNNNTNSDFYKNFQNINFLSQNYRPKCDICDNFCMVNWYISKENLAKNNNENEIESDNDMGVSISIDEKSIKKDFFLICEDCYNNKDIPLPKNLKRENFENSTVYNLFSKDKLNLKLKEKINEQKWSDDENKKLMESMKLNNNWDDVIKSLGKNNNKTKKDCILHLLQMPVIELNDDDESDKELNDSEKEKEKDKENEKENNELKENNNNEIDNKENEINQMKKEEQNIQEKENEVVNNINNNNNEKKIEEEKKDEEKYDKMNNKMLEICMRLFKRYLNEKEQKENANDDNNGNVSNKSFKEVIYKTFAKSIDKCKELKNEEKNEMKNIVDILVYLEMRKIELKMNYFRQFERLLEYKKTQLKTIETQIIQERIKLITKKLLLQQKQQQANENKQ